MAGPKYTSTLRMNTASWSRVRGHCESRLSSVKRTMARRSSLRPPVLPLVDEVLHEQDEVAVRSPLRPGCMLLRSPSSS